MNNKGFTLIELLVVIAIIGILAGVIVVSMDGSSDRARNARIRSAMDNVRTRMELLKADVAAETGNYRYPANGLSSDAEIIKLREDMSDQGATSFVANSTPSTESNSKYCFEVKLNSIESTDKYWCIDSSGYAGNVANCDGTDYACE